MATAKKAKKPAHKVARKAAPKKAAAKKPAMKHSATKAPRAAGSEGSYMKYSGKFTVRLPRSLHQALVERADREGVSLNLFVTNALSSKVAVAGGKKR